MDRAQAWNFVVEHLFRARNREVDVLKTAVRASAVPLSETLVQRLSQLNPDDVKEVLTAHPGHVLRERLRSYRWSYSIFVLSFDDLFSVLRKYEEAALKGDLFTRINKQEFERHQAAVQKEIFAATNSAHSLRDHSVKQLHEVARIPGFDDQLHSQVEFDGLHNFVIGLRNALHHVFVIRPSIQITTRFADSGNPSFLLYLSRTELMKIADDLRENGRTAFLTYLMTLKDDIDLKGLMTEYHRRVVAFHTWFADALEREVMAPVQDIERCFRANRIIAAQTWWSAMMGNWLNWKQPPNPYDHLAKYLTPKQLEEVFRLPKGSREQVDRIISIVDEDDACTDEIRARAYELFRRAAFPAGG